MSSIDPIEVSKDLPESHVHELLRLEELDGRHALEHKTAMNADSCTRCWAYVRAMRSIAEGNTSPVMEAVEKVARKLAEHTQARNLIEGTPEDYWSLALRTSARDFYRDRAIEIIEVLDLPLSIVPEQH
jgi:hypothetical protein